MDSCGEVVFLCGFVDDGDLMSMIGWFLHDRASLQMRRSVDLRLK